MPRIEEPRLKSELKAGVLARVYYFSGEEIFLTKMYTERIIKAAIGDGDMEMNFMKYSGNPKADELSDYTDSMPFFAERKCVLLADLEPESMDTPEVNAYVKLIENLPDTTVLIIAETSVEVDIKKPKAKTKKIIAAAEKAGASCEFRYMSLPQIAAMSVKKAARAGCVLSPEDGAYLAQLCGRSLSTVSNEVEKLCAYKGEGQITREDIDKLTPKLIDTSVYTLAGELFAGRTDAAFRVLDDLFAQRIEPVVILSALSGHFVDLYRAKLAQGAKATANDAAAAFKYPPNRAFVMRNAYSSAKKLSERYLGECVDILYGTNLLLNSSKADKRGLIERALVEIAALEK
ncbi:MAG: DNA polymerase III subunit delta [Oscillospiraceae bacterium]